MREGQTGTGRQAGRQTETERRKQTDIQRKRVTKTDRETVNCSHHYTVVILRILCLAAGYLNLQSARREGERGGGVEGERVETINKAGSTITIAHSSDKRCRVVHG